MNALNRANNSETGLLAAQKLAEAGQPIYPDQLHLLQLAIWWVEDIQDPRNGELVETLSTILRQPDNPDEAELAAVVAIIEHGNPEGEGGLQLPDPEASPETWGRRIAENIATYLFQEA